MLGVRNFGVTKWPFPWCKRRIWYGSSKLDNFFNRSKELKLLEDVTKGDGKRIMAITGPVNSGKTLLLGKVMEILRKKHVPVLDINLRSISFNSVEGLTNTLLHKLNLWAKDFEETSKNIQLDVNAYGVRFGLAYEIHKKPIASMPPLIKLNGLLDHFSATQLPPPSFWQRSHTPVFLIDEASEPWSLKKAPDGKDALHNLFKWFVMNSKEKKNSRFYFVVVIAFSICGWLLSEGFCACVFKTIIRIQPFVSSPFRSI